jgi:hypothetical protein
MGRGGRAAAGRDSWCAARGRKTSMASPGRSGRLPLPLCHGLVWIPWPHKPHGCPRSEREGRALRKRDPADLASTNLAARVPTTPTGPTLTLPPYSSIAVLCLPPACQAFRGSLPSLHALGAVCLVFLPCAVGSRRRRLSTWFRRRWARLSHL